MKVLKASVLFVLFGLLVVVGGYAFKPPIHIVITTAALQPFTVDAGGRTFRFSARAITEIYTANKNTDFCPSCQFDSSRHFDSEDFFGASRRIAELKDSIITKITTSSPNGASARADLGTALHTIQDFYSHSSWVDLKGSTINTQLGRDIFIAPDGTLPSEPCPNEPGTLAGAGRSLTTSGHFSVPFICSFPARKCRHGDFAGCPTGISKDRPIGEDGTPRPNFDNALRAARDATTDFLNQIVTDSRVAGNVKAIKALMDVKSTLGFVIDDTGSMGDIIGSVKEQVATIVNGVVGTDSEPDLYLLESFNDPTVGTPVVTADAPTFISAVNALFAHGGGDCPELPMTGLLQAIQASTPDATLFLFTDASAKDGFLAGSVAAAAQAKGIRIDFLLFGSCSPVDPAFVKVASQTGGQVFFLARSQAGQTFALVKPEVAPLPLVTVLTAGGTLTGSSQEFKVPLDSTMSSATFSVAVDTLGPINLLDPSGTVIAPGQPGVTITDLSAGRIFTVSSPQTGNWRLQVAGTGSFSVAAQANSSIQFNSFQFVALSGRAGHEGLFPIPGQPIIGSSQTALAILLGSFQTASFTLVSEAGDTIQPIVLAQGNPNAGPDEFVGTLDLPAQSFRVAVSGLDASGLPYRRLFPTLFRAQVVMVAAPSPVDTLAAGTTTRLLFVVRNVGAPSTFRITATDNCGVASNCRFVGSVDPSLMTLDGGASATVNVDVTVPPGTAAGTGVSITVTATNTADPSVTNSTTQSLVVAGSDTIPPATTASPSPGPNGNGWNNANISVTLDATDNPGGSGVKQIQFSLAGAQSGGNIVPGSTATVTVSTEGVTTLTYFATDNAGNQETANTLTLRIDKTPPVILGLPTSSCTLWPPNHKLVQVATVTASDALSGLAPGSFRVSGTSNEPSDPTEPDIVINPSGSGFGVQLRSERLGTGTGRIYTISAAGADLAGNVANATATCIVPHDQGH